jgi:hypothetical protein
MAIGFLWLSQPFVNLPTSVVGRCEVDLRIDLANQTLVPDQRFLRTSQFPEQLRMTRRPAPWTSWSETSRRCGPTSCGSPT